MLRKLSTWLSQNKSPLAKLGGMSAPIVVGGTGGSGTRVVQALLSDVGVYMGKALNQPGDAMQFEPLLDEKINPVLSQVHSLDYTPDAVEKELRKEILQIIHQTAALYIEDMPQGANSEGNPRWGWKNPRSMFLLPLIHSVFPELYYIHVVRDGRDMAFSKNQNQPHKHYQALFNKPYSASTREKAAVQAIELWSKANLDTAAYGEKQLKERYIRVRFEDLCQNPEAEAVRMLSALSIPRSPTEAALKSVEKPTSVGRFQEEADLIEAVTKAGRVGLKEFGYL